jgi:predicted membrane protein DUF2079
MIADAATLAPGAGSPEPIAGREGSFWLSWLIVAMLTATLTAVSTYQSLTSYREFRNGWPWDLAYYNQWYWALTYGNREVTVRPLSKYAEEGPSVWKMNYLAPIRFAIVPFYRLCPDPRTLLVIQNIMFWWVIPGAYTLVRSESRSRVLAVSAALLVPLTPLLWPLVWNDFRELQLAVPFVLWAIQGIRSRSTALAVLGISGMLACRQEFAVMAATFAFIPPRDPESLSATLRWRHLTLLAGTSWFLFGFLGYLRFFVGRNAPGFYVQQFLVPRASAVQVIATSFDTLAHGIGVWAVLACFAPRVAILAVPWIWGPCSGEWSMNALSTADWHHVRYVLPMAALLLTAGLIGYARVGCWLLKRHRGWLWLTLVWAGLATTEAVGLPGMKERLDQVPVPIDRQEAGETWERIRQVGADEGVIAHFLVSAPLSSRRHLYSYVVDWNRPFPYPKLDSRFHWLFIRNDYPLLNVLLQQGFEVEHRGKTFTIAHRSQMPTK